MNAAAKPTPCPDPAACVVHEAHTLAGVGVPYTEPIPTIAVRRSLTLPDELGTLRHLVTVLGLPFDDVFELRFSKAGDRVVLEAELRDSARIRATS